MIFLERVRGRVSWENVVNYTQTCEFYFFICYFYFWSMLMTLLQILKRLSLFLQMTPLCFIQISVLSTCSVLTQDLCTLRHWSELWNVTFNPPKAAVLTISSYRNDDPPLLFNNTHLSGTDTHKHLDLLFHHSLTWHTHTLTSESDDQN